MDHAGARKNDSHAIQPAFVAVGFCRMFSMVTHKGAVYIILAI